MSAVIPRSTVEALVGHRNKALELYRIAYDRIREADVALKAAHSEAHLAAPGGGGQYTHAQAPEINRFYGAVSLPDADEFFRVSKRVTDMRTWGYLHEYTELDHLMDKEAKDKLRKQMTYVPERVSKSTGRLINEDEIAKGLPEIDVDTIRSTIEMWVEDAPTTFARGLANAFSKLEKRFKSHDGFKIGSRIILTNCFGTWGEWDYGSNIKDTLTDIERVFLILDGKGPRANYAGIVGMVSAERRELSTMGGAQSEHEGDYFRVRCFKNGNAHLWFSRDDLVEKANKILADYYGEVIGEGNDVAPDEYEVFENPTLVPAKHFGFYPTPEKVVRKITLDLLYTHSGSESKRILEPSAGTGNIARILAAEQVEDSNWKDEADLHRVKHHVTCIEIQPELAEGLIEEGIYNVVRNQNFLMVTPDSLDPFDVVVMNPPFDMQRDIDHVMHAWKFLKPGGTLISIMSAGTEFRTNKKATMFRKFVKEQKGRFEDLPMGSFSDVGTNVSTCFVKITK